MITVRSNSLMLPPRVELANKPSRKKGNHSISSSQLCTRRMSISYGNYYSPGML